MNLYEILQSWISNPEYITSDEVGSDYVARHEQRKALKKLPMKIAIPLRCFFDFTYYHKPSNIQYQPFIKLEALITFLKFLQDKEVKEDIDKIFSKINEEILNYIKKPQAIESYLGWWIVVFLYDKFPSYKHSEELDKLLWDNLERNLRSQIITPNKTYLVKWLKIIARYDRNDSKDLRLKKIFMKLAFNWIIFQRKSGTDKNNDEILEILSAVNNISLNFENPSDKRQFNDLNQKFAQLNFEYSVGGQKKLLYYWFMKKTIRSIDDLFFDSLIHLRFDRRSGVTYSIWKGTLKSISRKVAIKCFSSSNEADLKKYEHEAKLLRKATGNHDFFLQYYAAFYDNYINKADERAYYIVMQFCSTTLGKEINERIEKGKEYGPFLAYDIYQLLEGFLELRKKNICHHDIKPDNIFIDEYGNFKIGDFGLSYAYENEGDDETNTVRGTIDYMSPELREAYGDRSFKSKNIHFSREKSDVFSLGLVFLKMATLKSISGLNLKWSQLKLKNEIFSIEPRWLSRLLSKMLDMNFKTRASFNTAFVMLMSDNEFLKEKYYIINDNKVETFSSFTSRSTKYCIEHVQDLCGKFDINNINSFTEPLKFICELDKSIKNIIFLKEFVLQKVSKFLGYFFVKMTQAERKQFNFIEILNLINMISSDNNTSLHDSLMFLYIYGRKPTQVDIFSSDAFLGNQIKNSDFWIDSAIENTNNITKKDFAKYWDYSGDISDINQIEIRKCQLCINDQYPGIKVERYKGRIKINTIEGIKVPSNKKISIMIYSFPNPIIHTNKEKISSTELDLNKWIEKFEKEACIMKIMSSKGKNFLHYYGAFYQRFTNISKFYIITEAWKYSLKKEIINSFEKNKIYCSYMIASIVYDLLNALIIMKENKIVHNGLCTEVIVVPEEGFNLKIIDFSFSLSDITENSLCETKERTVHISKDEFVAPEQLTHQSKAKFRREKADVFSLGLIFFQIWSLEPIDGFNRDTNILCDAISKIKIPWLARLLSQMLIFDYKNRPGLKEVSDILRTDEEYINDLLMSNAMKEWQKKQLPIKYLQQFAFKDNEEATEINLSLSQESTNYKSNDVSFIPNLYNSSSDNKLIGFNSAQSGHEQYYTREFFLASEDQFHQCEEMIHQLEKFSGKRNLFLKYFGMSYQKTNEEDKTVNEAKIVIKLELCKESLSEYMEKNKSLRDFQIAGIANDLIRSFKYLARKEIYLFDINSDDFIINQFSELKIYKYIKNFQYWHDGDKNKTKSPPISFMSPEVLKMLKISNANEKIKRASKNFSREKAALYSVGLIILYMCMGKLADILNEYSLQETMSRVNPKWAKEILAIMLNPSNMDRPRFGEIISAQEKNEDFQKDLDIYRLSQKILHWPSNKKPTYIQNSKNNSCIIFDKNERRQFYATKLKNNFEEFEMK